MPNNDASAVTRRLGGRRIFVSSNCQTGPIAQVLRIIFPDDEISAAGQIAGSPSSEVIHAFADKLRGNDIWVRYCDVGPVLADSAIASIVRGMTVVDIPHINFHAFHPDLFYAFRAPGVLMRQHYNSGILIWTYKHGIDTSDAKRLFDDRSFASLGTSRDGTTA
jgi:hypothetical protein